jgi:hypothetical protein
MRAFHYPQNGEMVDQDRSVAPRIAALLACELESLCLLRESPYSTPSATRRQFWDNKVLPTQVMPEEARAEKKW